MAKKSKSKGARKAARPKVPKKPRQKTLFGEDKGIAEIERAAHDYADARDARMSMGEEEQRRHAKLIAVMKKHGKKTYVHRTGDEVIEIVVSAKDPEDKAKVRIKPADEYKPKAEPETEQPAADTDTEVVDDTQQIGGGEAAQE